MAKQFGSERVPDESRRLRELPADRAHVAREHPHLAVALERKVREQREILPLMVGRVDRLPWQVDHRVAHRGTRLNSVRRVARPPWP